MRQMQVQLLYMKLLDKGENNLTEEQISNLIEKAKNHDEQAMEELLQFFKPKVIAISREYFLVGAEFDDLLQEGMIGLYKAISVYDPQKNNNFSAFASLCIHRQLQNAVKNANRKKNSPLNAYLPIKYYDGSTSSDDDHLLKLVIVDDNSNIEQNYIDNELNLIMMSKVKEMLTKEQFDVLKQFLSGDSYAAIAQKSNLTQKQVDNMLQSIKRKLRTLSGIAN